MSSITTSTINTSNGSTDLTLTTGNTSGPKIVVKAENFLEFSNSVFPTVNATTINSNNILMSTRNLSANGHAYLPNGILMQWGRVSATTSSTTLTFSTGFPTSLLSLVLTGSNEGVNPWIISSNNTGAVIDVSNNSLVYYMAVGY